MIHLGDKDFEERIKTFLSSLGYQWPDVMDNLWFKGRFLFEMRYDPRECMSCRFGIAPKVIDERLPKIETAWRYQVLMPYSMWLDKTGINHPDFADALGGWTDSGLRTPNYATIEAVVVSTLAQVEVQAAQDPVSTPRRWKWKWW